MKPITFLADSRSAIRTFPVAARQKAGYQLDLVQRGEDPEDWKPIAAIGNGVREIRVREGSGAFRVIYLASLAEAVYVLHAFQKKSQRTPRRDIELARARFKTLMGRSLK